jgi:hypothetical protein
LQALRMDCDGHFSMLVCMQIMTKPSTLSKALRPFRRVFHARCT